MAVNWIKSQSGDGSYWQIGAIQGVKVGPSYPGASDWWIVLITGSSQTSGVPVKGPFADQATAQTALDNDIVALGGSV
jgi:hypothetical protein